MITDEAVREFYQQRVAAMLDRAKPGEPYPMQCVRGVTPLRWKNNPLPANCRRHAIVFVKFNVIPAYCFDCYKIKIAPRTVVELCKLKLVFDEIELPNDNTRKCMVETRPDVSGAYSGLIYCQSLDDAKQIKKLARKVVSEEISERIPVSIKRGCSEYALTYPEYNSFDENGNPVMHYDETWRRHEEFTDRNLVAHLQPLTFDSYNPGVIGLKDVRVIHGWLGYAATIGDESYLRISDTPMPKLRNVNRPPFEPVEDTA